MVNSCTKLKSSSKQAPHPRHEKAEHIIRAPTPRSLKKKLSELGRQASESQRKVELLRSELREAEAVILDGV